MEDPNAVVPAIISTWLNKRGYTKTLDTLQKEASFSLEEYIAESLNEPSIQNLVLFHENQPDVSSCRR